MQFLHAFAGIEVAHRPSEQIRFSQAEASQFVSDAQYLFLVQDDAKGLIQQGCQGGMQMLHRFITLEAPYEGILQSAGERAGTIQGQRCHDVVFVSGVDLAQGGAHAGTFDLEAADGLAMLDQVGGLDIIGRGGIQDS